jgi:polyribonucleotide nucleotidyltransferase
MAASVHEHLGLLTATSPEGPFVPEENFLFDHSIDGHIFIDDDGTIRIAAINAEQAEAAKAYIDAIVFEPVVGAVYTGTVTGIKEFGCFVEYAPGKEGMVHISKIAPRRIEKVEDVLKLGDVVKVKYIGLDKKGRMDFSIKDALEG